MCHYKSYNIKRKFQQPYPGGIHNDMSENTDKTEDTDTEEEEDMYFSEEDNCFYYSKSGEMVEFEDVCPSILHEHGVDLFSEGHYGPY